MSWRNEDMFSDYNNNAPSIHDDDYFERIGQPKTNIEDEVMVPDCKCDWCGVEDYTVHKTASGSLVCYMCFKDYTS